MRRVCLALLLLLPLMLLPALGAEVSFSQADELLEAAEDYGVDPQASLETGVQGILQAGLDQLGEMLRRSLGTGIKLLAVALLCGLAEGTALDQSREGLNAVKLAGALAVTALTVSDMTAMIGLGLIVAGVAVMHIFSKSMEL